MEKAKLEKYERKLLRMRTDLLSELGYLEDEVLNHTAKDSSGDLSAYSFHMADLGTDAMRRETGFLLASKEGRMLLDVNDALRRIQDKSYGLCIECGKKINTKRLDAIPHASLCIKCQADEEKNNHQ
jgi:RNA polymerase-binding transcription factor DksA